MNTLRRLVLATLAGVLAWNVAAQDDLAKIKAAGRIRFASEGNYSPFTYYDQGGELVGFDVEIGKEVAKRLGVRAQFIDGNWDSLIAGLDVNRWDAVINQVTITEARQKKYDFSDPYSVTRPVLVVREGDQGIKGFSDLRGKKVVANLTTTYAELARKNGATVITSDLPFDLILSGRAEATINDRLFFLDYRKRKPETPLKIVATFDSPNYQGIIFRKNNPRLLEAVNAALSAIKADGTYQALSQKYFGEDVSR